jgi:hypothetical protein
MYVDIKAPQGFDKLRVFENCELSTLKTMGDAVSHAAGRLYLQMMIW